MQQATCIAAAIKPARKWQALDQAAFLMPVGRSVQRSNRPPGSCPCNMSVKRPSGGRFARSLAAAHVALTIAGRWRTMNIYRLDGIRCDWLQVASCNITLMRGGRLVRVLRDFFKVSS